MRINTAIFFATYQPKFPHLEPEPKRNKYESAGIEVILS
jgi:hypothetical protein